MTLTAKTGFIEGYLRLGDGAPRVLGIVSALVLVPRVVWLS